jgi:transmembrane sensor
MTMTSPTLLREASAWMVRLRDEAADAADHDAFSAWIAADPAHADAFDLVQSSALEIQHLGQDLRAHLATAPKRRSAPPVLALALGACALLLLGVGYVSTANTYQTALGEQRTVQLADGSTAVLNTDTRMAVRYEDNIRRIELSRGEAVFDVAHDADRPFIVEAQGQSVRALGTSFVVRVAEQGLEVLVIEGVVSVAPPAINGGLQAPPASAPRVHAGQRFDPAETRAIVVSVEAAEIERDLAWRSGMLQFDGQPLAEAADEIARYTGARFVIDESEIGQIPVWAFVRANDLDAFLSGLEQNVAEIDVRREGRIVHITRARGA